MSRDFRIRKILIEEGAEGFNQTKSILKSGHPAERVEPERCGHRSESLSMDKKTLRLIHFGGEFLKPCPGTRDYICCGYQILNVGTNCPMDCSYCILQAYVNQPSLRIFVNLQQELDRVGRIIDRSPEKIFRIGTGEFTDSLALDPITGWSRILSPFFSDRKNAFLELKTKTDRIEGLLASPHRDRIIVSWSLNSPHVATREEKGAPSIKERLLAAKICQAEGYAIGIHFDPLIHHPNWKEGYKETIEMMHHYLDPKGIIWISLGCLRYIPGLKKIIKRRHRESHIMEGEFIRGLDGKMRYFKPIRIEIMSYVIEELKSWDPTLCLYLCMESDEVWNSTLGWSPGCTKSLSEYLDRRAMEFYG